MRGTGCFSTGPHCYPDCDTCPYDCSNIDTIPCTKCDPCTDCDCRTELGGDLALASATPQPILDAIDALPKPDSID